MWPCLNTAEKGRVSLPPVSLRNPSASWLPHRHTPVEATTVRTLSPEGLAASSPTPVPHVGGQPTPLRELTTMLETRPRVGLLIEASGFLSISPSYPSPHGKVFSSPIPGPLHMPLPLLVHLPQETCYLPAGNHLPLCSRLDRMLP